MCESQHLQDRRFSWNPPPVCFNCGVTGHFVVACPQTSRETPAGFTTTQTQDVLSQNQSIQHRHESHRQYSSGCPTQLYSPQNERSPQPSHKIQNSIVVPYSYPTCQKTQYLAFRQNESLYYSKSLHASQNNFKSSSSILPCRELMSNISHPALITNYQEQSFAAESIFPDNCSIITQDSSRYRIRRSTPYSGFSKKHFEVKKVGSRQAFGSVSATTFCGNSTSNRKCNPNQLQDVSHNHRVGPPCTISFKERKSHSSDFCSNITADTSDDCISNLSPQTVDSRKTISSHTDLEISESRRNKLSPISANMKNCEIVNHIEKENDEELWEWEYDSIFKDPPRAETVELAQPLTAGFKSTPVPLCQPWSSTTQSVSRYARKDNSKEFSRSIRCSPQWSYMQEDPAFIDIEFDGSLVPFDQIKAWIAMRQRSYKNSYDVPENNLTKDYCLKRDGLRASKKIDEQSGASKVEFEAICSIEEPSVKKQKFSSLAAYSNQKDVIMRPLTFTPCHRDLIVTNISNDENASSTRVPEIAYFIRDTRNRKRNILEDQVSDAETANEFVGQKHHLEVTKNPEFCRSCPKIEISNEEAQINHYQKLSDQKKFIPKSGNSKESNINNSRVVGSTMSPTVRILNKLNSPNKRLDDISRSKQEFSKRLKRSQPEIQAAYRFVPNFSLLQDPLPQLTTFNSRRW